MTGPNKLEWLSLETLSSQVLEFVGKARANPMEQHTLKNVNICLNTNIYSYLETSGGQSSNPYLNVVHFFNTRVN